MMAASLFSITQSEKAAQLSIRAVDASELADGVTFVDFFGRKAFHGYETELAEFAFFATPIRSSS